MDDQDVPQDAGKDQQPEKNSIGSEDLRHGITLHEATWFMSPQLKCGDEATLCVLYGRRGHRRDHAAALLLLNTLKGNLAWCGCMTLQVGHFAE